MEYVTQYIDRYAKANNKYMKYKFDKNKESSHSMYLVQITYMDGYCFVNCLQMVLNEKKKLRLMKTSKKNYDEDSDKGYILEVDVEYPKNLLNLHGDLPFLAERKKIKKCNKFVCNINDEENYVAHIRPLNQAIYHGLILRKVHRVIQFNQEE